MDEAALDMQNKGQRAHTQGWPEPYVHTVLFWQGNHQIYGQIRCNYTVLANPTYTPARKWNLLESGHLLESGCSYQGPSTCLASTQQACTLHTQIYTHSHVHTPLIGTCTNTTACTLHTHTQLHAHTTDLAPFQGLSWILAYAHAHMVCFWRVFFLAHAPPGTITHKCMWHTYTNMHTHTMAQTRTSAARMRTSTNAHTHTHTHTHTPPYTHAPIQFPTNGQWWSWSTTHLQLRKPNKSTRVWVLHLCVCVCVFCVCVCVFCTCLCASVSVSVSVSVYVWVQQACLEPFTALLIKNMH